MASSAIADCKKMDDNLVHIFKHMVHQEESKDAIDFVRSLPMRFQPSTEVMQIIIFKIAMKTDDIRCLTFAYDYLVNIIEAHPPSYRENRQYYLDSIRDETGLLADLWTVFSHIVNSYFCHRDIYVLEKDGNRSDPIKYPNCKFLLEFYVNLFVVDFEQCRSNSSTSCLVMKLFWPDSRTICLSNRTEAVLKWINDIYGCVFVNSMCDLLGCMHKMLILIIRCIIEIKHNLSDFEAFSSVVLAEIVEAIVNFSKNAFENLGNFRLFLSFQSMKYLQAKISERMIRQILKISSKRPYVLTLRDIVDQYLFPAKYNKWRNPKPCINKEKYLRKRLIDKRPNISEMKLETTNLHEFCKKNKFGDLLEALESSVENLNARDHTGSTPLHEACFAGHRLCIKHLIDESSKDASTSLDFGAVNLEGLTPLHLAVMKDYVEVARTLLIHGGAELLLIADNKGQLPNDLICSEQMGKVLQEYQMELKDSNESDGSEDFKMAAPILKCFKDYSIYLDALNCLLCTYCNMFNLVYFVWKKKTVVSSHSDKSCCHFINEDICSDDASRILEMPNLIETFMESIRKNVSKSDINVEIELIPLRAFAASLKPS